MVFRTMGASILVSDILELLAKAQQGQVVFSRHTCFKYPNFSFGMNSFVCTINKVETTPVI